MTRLIRVAYGPFQLGLLPKGAAEEVNAKVLREQLGLDAPPRRQAAPPPAPAPDPQAPRKIPRARNAGPAARGRRRDE